jgi:GDP-L-fucose synthase
MTLGIYEAIAAECPDAIVINPIGNCAYPATDATFEEEHWLDGHLHRSVLSYGSTRRMLWATAECFQMQHGVRSINLLVPNMYGPNDSTDPNKAHALNALVSKFVKAQTTAEDQVTVWGTGIAIREWLYVRDFARIVLTIIRQPNMVGLHEPVNIAQRFGLSVRELVDLIVRATSFSGRVVYDHSMPDGAPRKVMDDRRFRKIFPEFRFTPLSEGIEAAVAYYRSAMPY